MSALASKLQEFWSTLAAEGWQAGAHRAAGLYPMPGEPTFDDDDLFMQLPVFPADSNLPTTLVADERWVMPEAWTREFETRPLSQRTLLLDLYLDGPVNSKNTLRAAEIFVRRCAYLELFRSRKPLSISTLRLHMHPFRYIAGYAVSENKLVSELDYPDLLAAIQKMPVSVREDVSAAHEMMRWWRAAAPKKFSGYVPPPSLGALQVEAEGEATGASPKGFDTTNIRSDGEERDPEGRTWQPLPDAFVAAMGEFCLKVSGELRPMYHSFLRDLIQSDPSASSSVEIALAAQAYAWPKGFEVTNISTAKKVGNVCQFSAMFLLALLLGPRSSEITALPLGLVKELSDGTHLISGSTFKLSQSTTGCERDWPIHSDLGKALIQQEEYIRLVEGDSFRFLFRSHASVAWGNKPVRQLYGVLNDMVGHTGLERFLDDSSFHPHRLRKTTARLIVIALHGGPLILRRLFGHQHLAMTLRYILTNQGIVDELRAIAEEEQRVLAAEFVKRRKELKGGGAAGFNAAVSAAEQVVQQLPEVFVPEGRREQAKVGMDQIIEVLAADPAEGLGLKQIVPGLIVCWKPSDEAGMCCKAGELPNIAKCSTKCIWHLQMPEYQDEARKDVQAALEHLKGERIGSLKWHYYSGIVRAKLADYPELRAEFASHPLLGQIMETIP